LTRREGGCYPCLIDMQKAAIVQIMVSFDRNGAVVARRVGASARLSTGCGEAAIPGKLRIPSPPGSRRFAHGDAFRRR